MRTLLRCIAAAIALLTACAGGPVGREFADDRALAEAFVGFESIHQIDVTYPARVVEVVDSEGTLRFVHRDRAHCFSFPATTAARAVVLEHAGGRGIVVLRGNSAI
ncbi:MAG: hypothetical protein RL398_1983 [Planctomycetota bacterium]|jgi:hypothetical protein